MWRNYENIFKYVPIHAYAYESNFQISFYDHSFIKQVDIYGKCGTLKCGRNIVNAGDETPDENGKCFDMLDKEYKFYLSFENSNCRDYITEKFFVQGLGSHVLPIAMGAPPEDYERIAPKRSFLHVENFESPKHLADYLHKLDQNDDEYNSYFKWVGTGEIREEYWKSYWCKMCMRLHDEQAMATKQVFNMEEWWVKGKCVNGLWRDRKNRTTTNWTRE